MIITFISVLNGSYSGFLECGSRVQESQPLQNIDQIIHRRVFIILEPVTQHGLRLHRLFLAGGLIVEYLIGPISELGGQPSPLDIQTAAQVCHLELCQSATGRVGRGDTLAAFCALADACGDGLCSLQNQTRVRFQTDINLS